eukprot:10564578-Ditylum_brightwellii.AAC.1
MTHTTSAAKIPTPPKSYAVAIPTGPPAKRSLVGCWIPSTLFSNCHHHVFTNYATLKYFPTLPAMNLFVMVAKAPRHLAQRRPSYPW